MLKKNLYPITLILFCFFPFQSLFPQTTECEILSEAVPRLTLEASLGGTNNRSGLAFNPDAELYYSVNAGSASYPLDTYDDEGNILASPVQAFDYRGAWWNPSANQLEGNGFSTLGIFVQTLVSGTSFPNGSGAVIFTANQPASQSVGTLNFDDNEIIYYDNGFIHRYSRVDNGFLGQFAITGLPVEFTDLNSNSVVYTGCEGKEIGLYDFVNRVVFFIDKVTGEFSGSSQLPESAPQRSSFGMSYANDLFWLFDGGIWSSFEVLNEVIITSSRDELNASINLYPNPVQEFLQIDVTNQVPPVSV
ncbi:MAG: hypothetical protein AAF363_06620 [Bacteroidota bacterium]